ncbi:MAG: GH1 family beta-glucosidase [Deltaproteobacteria bacterium]
MNELRFPESFVWGVATSAFQIEGATEKDGRAPSIWDTFAARPGQIADGSDGKVACDHYHRYPEDVGLMKSLGVAAYRFSVAWPRILPKGRGHVNEAGLDFYDRLVDELLRAGIDPWVTLYHWDLPQALEDHGGWTERTSAHAFVEYADVVSRRLGDRVHHWITHNEPWCSSVLGYAQGEHAPGKRSWADALAASHHLLLGHGWAVPVIRSNARGAEVGITLNLTHVDPASPSEHDAHFARVIDGEMNRWYLDPLFRGEYPTDIIEHHRSAGHISTNELEFVELGDLSVMRAPIDFLGINYYTRAIARSPWVDEGDNLPRTIEEPSDDVRSDMGWEQWPDGLRNLLVRVNDEYTPPKIYITENGAAFSTGPDASGRVADARRQSYVEEHLRACLAAIESGVPLEGYFLWSLLDNFEWAYGYEKRFGIVWVDFETQERIVKDTGHWYADVIRRNGLSAEHAA